jgi:hypothetical protein
VTNKTPKAIGVASPGHERPLTKGQKAFNALTEKIAKRRASLAEWEEFGTDFQRRYAGDFVPTFDRYNAVRREFVHCLDRAHDTKGLTKGQRHTIAEAIVVFAGGLLQSVDDPAVEEIYLRYSPRDAEAETAALDDLRDVLETTFGVNIGDDVDLASPDDVMRHVEEQLRQQEEEDRKRQEEWEAQKAKRKDTPRQKAAQERARAEEEDVHLSLRIVYRKLASALHPDRESDPVERERKAALMQRVNVAYGKRSLLDLLEIQLDLEHIDQSALDSISEDRLKRWNIILKDQLYGLDEELEDIQHGYAIRCGMMMGTTVSPKSVKRKVTADIANMTRDIKLFERDVRMFNEGRSLKEWIQEIKWTLAEGQF